MSGFLIALPVTLGYEGGETTDTGGHTYNGVTQAVFDDYLKSQGKPTKTVTQMTEAERDHLYYTRYWIAAHCDALMWPLSMVHFDCAVNTGVAQAIKILQRAVGARDDGVWGTETNQKYIAGQHDEGVNTFNNLLFERLRLYSVLANEKKYQPYFAGWVKRVLKLRAKARELW